MNTIHPTAIVDRKAELGNNVLIGPYCVIGPHVNIGDESNLHNHVTIEALTHIGKNNEIYPFSVIGTAPQDLKFRGEQSILIIGDNNTIREHVTIHRGTGNGGGETRIGNHNLLMVAAHVAHDCRIDSHCVIANQVMLGGHAIIEDFVSIGGGTGVHHYATIGTFAFIGGLVRVKKDVPPYMKLEGEPAEVRGVNTLALNRHNFNDIEIGAVKEAFKRLFMKQLCNGSAKSFANSNRDNRNGRPSVQPMSVAIEELASEFHSSICVRKLCDFIQNSSNGIHGRSSERTRRDKKFSPIAQN